MMDNNQIDKTLIKERIQRFLAEHPHKPRPERKTLKIVHISDTR